MVPDAQESLTDRIEQTFESIHRERMAGLPILNPHLAVRLVGLRPWQNGWLGVLITPWMMNLIALPGPNPDDRPGAPGTKRERNFPAGRFEFIAGEDPRIGPHETCSLYSPMETFADQESALATAESVLALLFDPSQGPSAATDQARGVTPGRTLSRRGLFRAALGGDAGG